MGKNIKAVRANETPDMTLTKTERMLLDGLQREANAIQERVVAEQRRFVAERALIGESDRAICDEIAARLGLPPGSIGKTHAFDEQRQTVIEKPAEPTLAPADTTEPPSSERTESIAD